MRRHPSVTSLLLGLTLVGCELLGPECDNYDDLPRAADFQPARPAVRVGQTTSLTLVVRQRAVTRIDVWHGSSRAASISGFACQPAGTCREIVDLGDATSLSGWGVESVSMLVTGLEPGRQQFGVDTFAPGDEPSLETCPIFNSSATVEVEVRP